MEEPQNGCSSFYVSFKFILCAGFATVGLSQISIIGAPSSRFPSSCLDVKPVCSQVVASSRSRCPTHNLRKKLCVTIVFFAMFDIADLVLAENLRNLSVNDISKSHSWRAESAIQSLTYCVTCFLLSVIPCYQGASSFLQISAAFTSAVS